MTVVITTSVSGWTVYTGTKQEVLDALHGIGSPANVISMFVDGASYSVLARTL